MHPYCELTDEHDGHQRFALHEMSAEELGLLADLLNSSNDHRAVRLRQAVNATVKKKTSFSLLINPPEVILCPVCLGVSKTTEEMIANNKQKIHSCQPCNEQGRMLKFTTIRYEKLTPRCAYELAQLPKRL